MRETPGQDGSYDLLFQLGSTENLETSDATLPLSSDIGLSGDLSGDGVYMVTITDHGDRVTGANLIRIATGLRNAAGMAFHPQSGDLYMQDNGIDGLENAGEAHSADEINVIAGAAIGGTIEDFGYPENYVAYRSGEFIGGAGIPALVAFLPLPDPETGEEAEGASDIAFAPAGFPSGLNNGLFVGFHGEFSSAGPSNGENPLVYVDLETGDYFHFVDNDQPGVGHLDGLLSTDDALYVSDLTTVGSLGGSGFRKGAIYQIRSLTSTAVEEEVSDALPDDFRLVAAYPNPFNSSTVIRFDLPRRAEVDLALYDVAGQRVATLIDGTREPDSYTLRWDGRNDAGRDLASGVYLYRMKAGSQAQARKLVLLR